MKKLTLTLSLITIVIFQAVASIANLTISSQENAPMKIIIDGQVVSQQNGQVTIEGIPAGAHYLQVNQTVYGAYSSQEVITFQGEIYLPANTEVTATVVNNQLLINNIAAIVPPTQNNYGHVNPNGNAFGNPHGGQYDNHKPVFHDPIGYGYGNPQPIGHGAPPQVTTCPNQGVAQVPVQAPGFIGGNHNPYQPVAPVYGPTPMDVNAFYNLKLSIENKWFSNAKMNVLESALHTNFFTAQQVSELVDLFTFSNDKVQVSQIAYTRTVDPQNYFLVYDVLDFNSSANELSAYIASL